ncbi:MAG TPA: sigma-70 family RNA polymerase sigma factor [Vicinamibacterales bacterium]
MKNETLFLSSLSVIDQATEYVCRRHHLAAPEADDFRSEVRLHFIQNDYAALQRFEGRSSLRTYLSVVIQRLFLDHRNRSWGKWRPSVEAKRLGPTAVLVERLVTRDAWTFDQVVEMLHVNHGVALDDVLRVFGARLSQRPPGRQFVSESEADRVESATAPPDVNVLRAEQDFIAKRVRTALARARTALAPEQRLVLKMRFDDGLPVADIARALHLNQKRLYRTIEGLLADLCRTLEADGISREDVRALFADNHLTDPDEERREPAPAAAQARVERTRTPWQQKR